MDEEELAPAAVALAGCSPNDRGGVGGMAANDASKAATRSEKRVAKALASAWKGVPSALYAIALANVRLTSAAQADA